MPTYLVASANHDILGFAGACTARAGGDLKQPDKQEPTCRYRSACPNPDYASGYHPGVIGQASTGNPVMGSSELLPFSRGSFYRGITTKHPIARTRRCLIVNPYFFTVGY